MCTSLQLSRQYVQTLWLKFHLPLRGMQSSLLPTFNYKLQEEKHYLSMMVGQRTKVVTSPHQPQHQPKIINMYLWCLKDTTINLSQLSVNRNTACRKHRILIILVVSHSLEIFSEQRIIPFVLFIQKTFSEQRNCTKQSKWIMDSCSNETYISHSSYSILRLLPWLFN